MLDGTTSASSFCFSSFMNGRSMRQKHLNDRRQLNEAMTGRHTFELLTA
jgi:hypothetical protein